jgi:hypothetical protein
MKEPTSLVFLGDLENRLSNSKSINILVLNLAFELDLSCKAGCIWDLWRSCCPTAILLNIGLFGGEE